jgi:ABC-type transport system involved in multi-copper enzyme maturation permease subunit
MIWLSWRQHRQQLLAGAIGLALLATWLFVSHLGIARMWRTTGLASCFASPGRDCSTASDTFSSHYQGLQFLIPLFLIIPLFVGLFWGAPLVAREIEQGTQRLAWTQSVTRSRWFWSKLAMIAAAAVAGAVAFAELVTWWSSMFVQAHGDRIVPGIFDIRGIVPVAYVLFALALGVLMGSLIRRTVPAMAATLAGFVAVRAVVTLLLRPHYLPSMTISEPILKSPGLQNITNNDWVLHTNTVNGAGHVLIAGSAQLDFNYLATRCHGFPGPGTLPSPAVLTRCVNQLGIHVVDKIQPGSRFWAFQGIESGIYVGLAVALFLVAAWIVRRRLA